MLGEDGVRRLCRWEWDGLGDLGFDGFAETLALAWSMGVDTPRRARHFSVRDARRFPHPKTRRC